MEEKTIRVLYVDDEESLLQIGKLFLEKMESISVDTSPSARDALPVIATGSYDAIISDYQMPGMDGIELLKEVRSRFGNIPFILFTGRGREEVVIEAINNGADFYLQKGGEPRSQFAELAHKVRQAVSQRNAEYARIESERTSRALLDATTDAVALITGNLTILAANEAFAQRFNKLPEELIGHDLHFFISPELSQNRISRVNEVLQTKKPVRFEDRRDDLFLENSYYPIFDEQGEVSRLAVYSRDISDKKRAELNLHAAYEQIAADEEELREKYEELTQSEKQVRESEEKFRSLTENSLDTIMLFDRELRHLYANPNIEAQIGVPPSELIGKTHAELGFPPHLIQLFEETLQDVFKTGNTRQIEFALPSGIWVDWLVVPIRNTEGSIDQVITSARDITERKKSEERIRLAEFSIEHSGVPTIWFNEKAQVIRANSAHCNSLGYTQEEMSHLTVHDFDPWYPQEAWDQIWLKIKNEKHVIIESEHRRKDGTIFPVEISNSYFEYKGHELCISFAHDISERKRANDELRAAYEQIAASEEELQRNYRELISSEAALRESEHKLADIINFAPDATFAIDIEGKVVAWNHAIEEFTGISASDIIGKEGYEYAIPFYGTKIPMLINQLSAPQSELESRYFNIRREGETLTAEASIHLLSGEERIVWAKASPLYDKEHSIVGAIESMRDVTEWRRTDAALKKSEAWFRTIFDQAFQLAGVLDLSGRVTQVNQTALNLIGKNSEEVVGIHFWETPWWIHNPSAQEKVKSAIHQASNGESIRFETTHVDQSGFVHNIDFSLKPIIDENGRVIALLPEGRDITGIKKIESDLIKSQEKLRTFINHTHDALFIHDQQGRILEVNSTMCQMYRIQPEEAVQYSIKDYTGPGSSIEDAKIHWNQALAGIDQIFDVQARRPKDGTLFDVEVFLTRIESEDGPIVLANVRDVTERRRVENDLRKSNEQITGIADTIPGVVYQFYARANGEMGLYFVSARSFEIFGIQSDITSFFPRFTEHVHHEDREQFLASINLAVHHESRWEYEGRFIKDNGSLRYFRGISAPVRVGDELVYSGVLLDITYQKETDMALSKEQAFNALLIETSPAYIVAIDSGGKTLMMNHLLLETLEYTAEEVIGKDYLTTFVPESDREDLSKIFKTITHDYSITLNENVIISKSGREYLVEWRGRPVIGKAGVMDFFVGIGIDVTASKQAEKEIQESELTYRGIFNTIEQTIYVLDKDGIFIDINSGAEKMYGYPREEIIGKTPVFLSAPEKNDMERVSNFIEKAFAGEPQLFEFWGQRKDGDIFPNEVRLCKGRYFGQDVIIATDTDISEHKHDEDKIRDAEQRLRTLINHIPMLAIQGYQMDGKTIYWHDTAEQLYGYSPEEAIGKNILDLIIPPEMHDDVRSSIVYMEKTGQPIPSSELILLRKDRTRVPVYSSHAILTNANGERELFCFDIDLTRHKQTEHAIRQANRKLNLLTNITRHDINNQITILQAYLDIIGLEELNPDIRNYLNIIQHATSTITSIIAFTKEYGDIGVKNPLWQNLAALIHSVVREFAHQKVSITCDIPEHLEIFADPLIRKVWYNLIENGIKYGEKITAIRFFIEQSDQNLIIVCEDDGVGIIFSEKERIFEFGFGNNTGLGLALSREILAITDITISETGEKNKGARFEILIHRDAYRYHTDFGA